MDDSQRNIFGISGPDGKIIFVGYSQMNATKIKSRYRAAAKLGGSPPIHQWIREHEEYTVEVLEVVKTEDAKDRVAYWVDYHIANGFPILNVTPEQRAAKSREVMNDPEVKAKVARNRPRTYSTSVSASERGPRHLSPEHRAKLSEVNTGRVVSEETRKKLSDAARGHSRTKGQKRSEETKAKMRMAHHTNLHSSKGVVKEGCALCEG